MILYRKVDFRAATEHMEELDKGAFEAASVPDAAELKPEELEDVTGGTGGGGNGPVGPHH